MIFWARATVIRERNSWSHAAEYDVELEDGTIGRALAYIPIVGHPQPHQSVLLTSAAIAKGLGTGGHYMIAAIPDDLPTENAEPGHIVKARYTPTQYMTMGVDEQESPYHEILRQADSIEGMPVIVADLHSAVAPAVLAARARTSDLRIAYVMDDGGALPAWYSQAADGLTRAGLILGTISCGQAFGGDMEAVNIHTGLLAARLVWHADIAVVAPGPGNLGTDTRWGFSGTQVGNTINAVNTLHGHAIALLRASSADERPRHRGISHHTRTALQSVALTPALLPAPAHSGDVLCAGVSQQVWSLFERELSALTLTDRLHRIDVETEGLSEAFSTSPIPLSTMGRSPDDDPLAFLCAGVAGYAAVDLIA
ncbi:MAG: DUF3866 family protein [Actinomycetaceae bacterium]|nr:DUF3866 family protein [Actinomycetaceae bacterium]MDY6083176.1 DUF3866 family protein [Actinomycetaceae bacterium]